MITNALTLVSLLLILSGIIGIKEHSIKKRLLLLALVTIGGLGISFSQTELYGLLSGLQQLPFKVLGFLFMWLLLSSLCKKNEIIVLEDLNGVRRFAPYTYALIAFMAVMLIGVPGTGTFTGIIYAQMGYMYGYSGVFAYVGMLGNVLAMIISALLIFPILREAFLFEKKVEKKDKQDQKNGDVSAMVHKRLKKPSVVLQGIAALAAVAMAVLSVWQGALTTIVTKIVESIM